MSGQFLAAAGGSTLSLSTGAYTIAGIVVLIALAALVIGVVLRRQVLAVGQGTEKMQEIGKAVQEGASAYLSRQFRTLGIFAVIIFCVLFALPVEDGGGWGEKVGRSIFFLIGALFSAAVGYLGMSLATQANIRVAAASREADGDQKTMKIAFRTGGVVGMFTVGLGLLGAAVVVLIFRDNAPGVLEGFGFGAAMLAMFMRVGGGIFTKAADVGADLVGKIEQGIPEDDPRNAATIADNVGDNVGDCAGMAADLFESYAVTLVAALILGSTFFGVQGLIYPLIVPAIGVITAVIGVYVTRVRTGESGLTAINRAFYISAVISAVGCVIAAFAYLPTTFSELAGNVTGNGDPALIAAVSVLIGIALAAVILRLTGHFTSTEEKPTKDVGKSSLTGPATVILSGVSTGFESAVYTAIAVSAAVFGAFIVAGGGVGVSLFAVSLAGTGLLTTVGVIVAMDTFGPVSDNAQGFAEMSEEVDDTAAQRLTNLDAVGNTTKAITKGIAIATAVLAASALFGSYATSILRSGTIPGRFTDGHGHFVANLISPDTLVGVVLGAAAVFLFSGLTINAVSRAAGGVVWEVRRQFRDDPGIMAGTSKPAYGKVVDLCTRDSLFELAPPGLLAIFAPIAVGFGLGVGALAGFLGGAIAAGVLMAIFLANSGGAWDNAKKIVEDGFHGGKGSEAHEATIIGDTVGDPFKDTAGPSIDPLIKVMNLVAVLIAPAVVALRVGASSWQVGVSVICALIAVAIFATAIVMSKRRSTALTDAQGGEGAEGAEGAEGSEPAEQVDANAPTP